MSNSTTTHIIGKSNSLVHIMVPIRVLTDLYTCGQVVAIVCHEAMRPLETIRAGVCKPVQSQNAWNSKLLEVSNCVQCMPSLCLKCQIPGIEGINI